MTKERSVSYGSRSGVLRYEKNWIRYHILFTLFRVVPPYSESEQSDVILVVNISLSL